MSMMNFDTLIKQNKEHQSANRHQCDASLTASMQMQDVEASMQMQDEDPAICVNIYVTTGCFVCQYAYEVADMMRNEFPNVQVRLIDLADTNEEIPDVVFATPTYLVNGRVWSLGNPSLQEAREKLQEMV